jgi:predicted tellurium resistance membrane protein TerC
MLLSLPGLKLVGALLLLYIGVKMLIPDAEEKHLDGHTKLWAAVKTIIVADCIMSLDNVLGVAAAAKGSLALLVIGLAISIPLIIYGSTLLLKLMNRYPIIVTVGGGILGWVAGEMAVSDPILAPWVEGHAHWLHEVLPAMSAAIVVALGKWMAVRKGGAAKKIKPEGVPARPEAPRDHA